MDKTVWLLWHGIYSDKSVLSAWSTEEQAKAARKMIEDGMAYFDEDECWIEEVPLDGPLCKAAEYQFKVEVTVNLDGTITEDPEERDYVYAGVYDDDETVVDEGLEYDSKPYAVIEAYSSKSHDHAMKIARDRANIWLAKKKGVV